MQADIRNELMEIQRGFTQLGVSVAVAFIGLSVVCLIFACTNYIEYRNEIAVEYKRFFGTAPEGELSMASLNGPEEKMKNWNRLKEFRYRSVDQSLYLAVMCVASSLIALFFWFAVGWSYVAIECWSKSRKPTAET